MSAAKEARWLDESQQRSWRALMMGITLLLDRLDADLRRSFDISLAEYEILVRLSELPQRQLRMAQLADAMAHSRSRVTHTVKRMEKAGLVLRTSSADDGRGVVCAMTDKGYELLESMAPVHVNGGAIAVGHPFGMTGARLQATMLNSLDWHDKTTGLVTMCVGGGQGMALILERIA